MRFQIVMVLFRYYEMLNWIRKEIKSIVREAMDDWVKDVAYLSQPTIKDGRYYCSKSDSEGVRFPTPDEVSESTHK